MGVLAVSIHFGGFSERNLIIIDANSCYSPQSFPIEE
jgi:hypothetical protein